MPTKRTRTSRGRRQPVSPTAWAWLTDAPMPEDHDEWELFMLQYPGSRSKGEGFELWEANRDAILTIWSKEWPGTRPERWWEHDAPRFAIGTYPDCYYDGNLPEPRRRTGGIGTPKHDVLAHVPNFHFGIPDSFVDQWEVDYYNGRAKDIHGDLIENEFHEGDFAGVAYDPDDPPTFESQAAYLDRHDLLTPGEKRALAPEAFEPEAVIFEPEE